MSLIEVTSMAPSRRGAPLTGKERGQYEAEQAEVRRLDKQTIAERAKAAGMKKRQMRDAEGRMVDVWMFSTSLVAMNFDAFQIAAAEKFGRDWEVAYRTLRGQTFEPSVDGARSRHGAHFSQVDAQAKIQACEQYLGKRSFEIVRAVVIYGATVRGLVSLVKADARNIRTELENAFNDLDAFYTGGRKKDRTWEAIEKFNMERAALIEAAEREVG